MAHTPHPEQETTIQVLVNKSLHKRLRKAAADEETTMLALVNAAVEKHLDHIDRKRERKSA